MSFPDTDDSDRPGDEYTDRYSTNTEFARAKAREAFKYAGAVLAGIAVIGLGIGAFRKTTAGKVVAANLNPANTVTYDADHHSFVYKAIESKYPGATSVKVHIANHNNYISWRTTDGRECTQLATDVTVKGQTPGNLIGLEGCNPADVTKHSEGLIDSPKEFVLYDEFASHYTDMLINNPQGALNLGNPLSADGDHIEYESGGSAVMFENGALIKSATGKMVTLVSSRPTDELQRDVTDDLTAQFAQTL